MNITALGYRAGTDEEFSQLKFNLKLHKLKDEFIEFHKECSTKGIRTPLSFMVGVDRIHYSTVRLRTLNPDDPTDEDAAMSELMIYLNNISVSELMVAADVALDDVVIGDKVFSEGIMCALANGAGAEIALIPYHRDEAGQPIFEIGDDGKINIADHTKLDIGLFNDSALSQLLVNWMLPLFLEIGEDSSPSKLPGLLKTAHNFCVARGHSIELVSTQSQLDYESATF